LRFFEGEGGRAPEGVDLGIDADVLAVDGVDRGSHEPPAGMSSTLTAVKAPSPWRRPPRPIFGVLLPFRATARVDPISHDVQRRKPLEHHVDAAGVVDVRVGEDEPVSLPLRSVRFAKKASR